VDGKRWRGKGRGCKLFCKTDELRTKKKIVPPLGLSIIVNLTMAGESKPNAQGGREKGEKLWNQNCGVDHKDPKGGEDKHDLTTTDQPARYPPKFGGSNVGAQGGVRRTKNKKGRR